jgi:hypothetical protein
MNGWISLHRKITEHWIWADAEKLKWWIDILLMVNHETNKVCLGMNVFDCERGQCIMSLTNWAMRWNVSRDKARNFLTLLEKDGMIHQKNIVKSTQITVCNYDSYQSGLHAGQTQTKRKANAKQTLSHINNKGNNENNLNNDNKEEGEKSKRFLPPLIDEVKAYCKERNNTVSPETFINFYQSKNWMVGKNKMKDWKACVRTWEGKERSSPLFNQPKKQQIESKTANQIYKTI